MYSLTLLSLLLTAAQPAWYSDYRDAYLEAKKQKKDLLIYFREQGQLDHVFDDADIKKKLSRFVCLKLPTDYVHKGERLLDHSAFEDMLGKPGLVIINLHDPESPFYKAIISAHPLVRSRYRWVPDYGKREIGIILDLPSHLSLTQRSMIYALRVHPENPKSVFGEPHAAFMDHCAWHCDRQASMMNQHHADLIGASRRIGLRLRRQLRNASEVVAESWGKVVGGENVLEAAFSCVDAWRHSPSHWGAVSSYHRYFGYDLSRARNGTWYATGIFAD
ncbi:MAG: hypothetical protein KatS3mg105_1568 [Gemmatales bacterium]|nr:MAG: hypothetical protein KatS3mg105_1568 [Gemmatales bacterium]